MVLSSSYAAPMTLIDRLYMKREATKPAGAEERQRTAKVSIHLTFSQIKSGIFLKSSLSSSGVGVVLYDVGVACCWLWTCMTDPL